MACESPSNLNLTPDVHSEDLEETTFSQRVVNLEFQRV